MEDIQLIQVPVSTVFPNNTLPVLLYKNVLETAERSPEAVAKRFAENDWGNNWVAGVLNRHHYHSTTHEALGVLSGVVDIQLGGPDGPVLSVAGGDVLIIPAGVAHKNLGGANDIVCVGGYPGGARYDMCYGHADELEQARRNIRQVPLPERDPVRGRSMHTWWP